MDEMLNGFFPLKMCYILFSDTERTQIAANTFTLFIIFFFAAKQIHWNVRATYCLDSIIKLNKPNVTK